MTRDDYVMYLFVDEIEVGDRREVDPSTVRKLAQSIKEIGLQHPITVRKSGDKNLLVAGRHRLEAVRLNGEQSIACHVVRWNKDRARMWEISENLHRNELTKLERAEQIEEWRALKARDRAEKGGQLAPPSGGDQPMYAGVKETASELEIAPKDVRRARDIANIDEDAKEAAREAGLADNQSALLKVAAAPKEQQVDTVRELAERRASKIDADVKDRAALEHAEWIAARATADELDGIKANLYAAGAANIANALTNLVGQSIMDRRFA